MAWVSGTAVRLEATTASTPPAGFVRTEIQGGSAARPATSLLGVPVLNAPIYAARVEGTTRTAAGTQIQAQALPAWLGVKLDTSRPCALYVTSGTFAGFTAVIASSPAARITATSSAWDVAQMLDVGDTFEVRPLHTLRTLFGDADSGVRLAAAADASRADQVLIQREGAWEMYWFTGSTWRRAGSAEDAGDDVVLPGAGILVYRRGTGAAEVRFLGEVPAADAVLAVPAGSVSTVANPFPAPVSLEGLGLEAVSGWTSADQPDAADQVLLCREGHWYSYWHDGAGWRGAAGPADEAEVAPGGAFMVVRRPAPTSNPFALVIRPYDA